MSDLRELYQQVILDHNKSPKNFRKLPAADRTAEGFNPLCGDRIHLYVKMDGDSIQDIGFEGSGCAISKASASMMTAAVKGKSRGEIEAMFRGFHHLVTTPIGGPAPSGEEIEKLGKLAVFSGVREFPARVKCAILAWHALQAAIKGEAAPISTE